MNILFHVLILLPLSFKIFFSWGFHGNSSNCLYNEDLYSKYPAKEKMGKEEKKKRGEEERKQNMKVEKTDSNSAHT